MATALKLSDLDESVLRETQLKARLKHVARLSEQKDAGKRMWNEMPATEQQLIEDFETQKSIRHYEKLVIKKPRINY